MYHSAGKRRDDGRRLGAIELVCVLLVVASIVALVVWIMSNAGGGHFVT